MIVYEVVPKNTFFSFLDVFCIWIIIMLILYILYYHLEIKRKRNKANS